MPRSRMLVVGVGAAVVVLASFLGYAYRPAAAVERAINNVRDLKTAQFKTTIVVENAAATTQLLGEEGEIEIVIDGQIERKAEGQDNLSGTVVATTRTEGLTVDLTGEIRMINDKVYVYIERAPKVFPILVLLKGKWLMFDRGGSTTEAQPSTGDKLFAEVDRVGTETVDDHLAVRYRTQATDQAIVSMMDGIADALGTELSDAQISQIRQSAAQVKEVPVDIWIDRFTNNLRQLKTTLAVPGGNTVAFTLLFREKNKPVDITVPEDAVTLQSAIEELRAENSDQ